jgi:hypothetical protein
MEINQEGEDFLESHHLDIFSGVHGDKGKSGPLSGKEGVSEKSGIRIEMLDLVAPLIIGTQLRGAVLIIDQTFIPCRDREINPCCRWCVLPAEVLGRKLFWWM